MSGSRREVPASDETASMLRQLAVIADVRKVLGACSSRVLTVVQSFQGNAVRGVLLKGRTLNE
jgi:hypothetical protein